MPYQKVARNLDAAAHFASVGRTVTACAHREIDMGRLKTRLEEGDVFRPGQRKRIGKALPTLYFGASLPTPKPNWVTRVLSRIVDPDFSACQDMRQGFGKQLQLVRLTGWEQENRIDDRAQSAKVGSPHFPVCVLIFNKAMFKISNTFQASGLPLIREFSHATIFPSTPALVAHR
jgi:hypothetical protein